MRRPITHHVLLETVREFMADNHPDQVCEEVRLKLTRGKIVLLMPSGTPEGNGAEDGEPAASNLRDQILELLSETSEPIKGTTIACRLERPYSGSFRATLKTMREAEEIVQDAATKRYTIGE